MSVVINLQYIGATSHSDLLCTLRFEMYHKAEDGKLVNNDS